MNDIDYWQMLDGPRKTPTLYLTIGGMPVKKSVVGDNLARGKDSWVDCDEKDRSFWKYRNRPHRVEDLPRWPTDEFWDSCEQYDRENPTFPVKIDYNLPKYATFNPPGPVFPKEQ